MAEKTVRRRSVSRRPMLLTTAGMLGTAGFRLTPTYAESNAAPAAATPGTSPPASRYGDPAWWAQRKEEILEPALEIVDPHHHLWDRHEHRYLLDQLLADTGSGHNVPPDGVSSSYAVLWNAFKRLAADFFRGREGKAVQPYGQARLPPDLNGASPTTAIDHGIPFVCNVSGTKVMPPFGPRFWERTRLVQICGTQSLTAKGGSGR